jgi:hypothetical protein
MCCPFSSSLVPFLTSCSVARLHCRHLDGPSSHQSRLHVRLRANDWSGPSIIITCRFWILKFNTFVLVDIHLERTCSRKHSSTITRPNHFSLSSNDAQVPSIHPSIRLREYPPKSEPRIGLHRTLPTTPDPVLQTASVKQRAGYLKGYKGC